MSANAQTPRIQRSDTPIVPKKGIFGAGIKPPVINITKPQACIDSLCLYNKKIKEHDDSIKLHHPETNTYGEYFDMRNTCHVAVDIDFFKEALHKKVKNKMVYTLMIRAEYMQGISIGFSQLSIPEEAEIYAYTNDRKQIASKFSEWGNFKRKDVLQVAEIPALNDNGIIIEYAEPIVKHSKRCKSSIKINKVYCVFKNTLLGQNHRDNCTIDINCQFTELKERFAVGKIYSQSSYGTGTLLQNTANDGKLYFLTAKHTVDGILATGATLSNVFVDFNYQSTSCNAPTATTPYFYTIKNIIASNSLTDFALLELDSYPEDCMLTYAGWDKKSFYPIEGFAIHHPQGEDFTQEPMRVSTYNGSETNNTPITISSDIFENYTLWRVHHYQQQVKIGSSGCSLLNEDKRVIGQLVGSSGNCDDKSASYGRFDVSWNNGNSPLTRLADWLDPLGTTNENNTYVVSRYPFDLEMKDNWCDTGTEPNFNCTHGTGNETWDDIWESPDLWNCQGTNDCTEPQAIKAGQTNRLRFNIRNPNNCTSDVPTIHLYWTVASTGEVWPEDWIHNNDNCMQGNEIGTLTLPALAPNETRIGSVNWVAPSLSTFSGCDANDINDLVGSKMEMCLLARLETPSDPIIREEQDVPVTINILNNNNIVTRNTVLEDIQYNQTGQASIIHIKNNNHFDTNLNLVIKGLVKLTLEEAQQLHIDIILTQSLWDRWTSTGAQGIGVQIIEPKVVRVTNLNTAKLLNIPMLADESRPFGVRIKRINSGKVESSPTDYKFGIIHEAFDPHIIINKSSGCVFNVHTKTNDIPISSNNLVLLVYPNPSDASLNLSFNLPNTEAVVSLYVYDMQGRLVNKVFEGNNVQNGVYSFDVKTEQLPRGIYMATLKTTQDRKSTKISIIK